MPTPTNVYEQLESYCNCTEVEKTDVDELINLISMATCWSNSPCETFLVSDRKETFDFNDCKDKCDIFEFRPFYHPYNKDSFTFTFIKQDGLTETVIPIGEENIFYSEVDEVFKINLPLDECQSKCHDECFVSDEEYYWHCCHKKSKCNCDVKYKLLITYEAGFNLIPDCLLPIFCDLLDLVHKKNKCDCDCDCKVCSDDDNYRNQLDYGQYTVGDVISYNNLMHFSKLLTTQYNYQLGLISLCDNINVWGLVV